MLCRALLHAINLWHGADGFTSPPKEVRVTDFYHPQKSTVLGRTGTLSSESRGTRAITIQPRAANTSYTVFFHVSDALEKCANEELIPQNNLNSHMIDIYVYEIPAQWYLVLGLWYHFKDTISLTFCQRYPVVVRVVTNRITALNIWLERCRWRNDTPSTTINRKKHKWKNNYCRRAV
jgi:hypothetical protein